MYGTKDLGKACSKIVPFIFVGPEPLGIKDSFNAMAGFVKADLISFGEAPASLKTPSVVSIRPYILGINLETLFGISKRFLPESKV